MATTTTKATTSTKTDGTPEGIPLSGIDPDFDGDGKVSPLEKEIYAKLVAADTDKSGYISTHELYGAITELVQEKKKVKNLVKLSAALMIALLLTLASMLCVSIVANEATKESHVGSRDSSTMTSRNGDAVRVNFAILLSFCPCAGFSTTPLACSSNHPHSTPCIIQVDTVESFLGFYDLASASQQQLHYIKTLNFYIDATSSPTYGGGWVPTSLHLGGALKTSANTVLLRSNCGASITIDGHAQTASITWPDGTTLPADGSLTDAVANRMLQETSPADTFTREEGHRRKLLFGTSGSGSMASFDWALGV